MSKLAFVWDNFGPLHVDRCEAVARKFDGVHTVIGLELTAQSQVYDWVPESGIHFTKKTLIQGKAIEQVPFFKRFFTTLRGCLSLGRDTAFFMCHYQDSAILGTAAILRVLGRRVYAMGCSKFDDYQRSRWREVFKGFFFIPYNGALASGIRSCDYMRFMGFEARRIAGSYNTVSQERIRKMADAPAAPEGVSFSERHFTIVARLVPKKNLSMAIKAMAIYVSQVANPRPLHIFGTGKLDSELRELARSLQVDNLVHFRGFQQTAVISRAYGHTLALLLPSIEEQFGNVVPEALAMSLPIVLSDNCGARDELVRNGVNGFLIEPDNPEGLAYFMQLLSEDESLWRKMCIASMPFAYLADSGRFADSVETLLAPR